MSEGDIVRSPSVVIQRACSVVDLIGIKSLQNENLKRNLLENEIRKEGFVTAEYSVEFLEELHSFEPSIVCKSDDDVVGYTIAVHPSIRGKHPLLDALFADIDVIEYEDSLLRNHRYLLCGQLCVKKSFRGQGLSTRMYEYFRTELMHQYDYLITEVAAIQDH